MFGMKSIRLASVMVVLSGAALLVACGDNGSSSQGVTPVSWMVPSVPGEAVGVNHAKVNAKEGEAIVVRGRIGGRKDPLSPRSPVFTIIDMSLSACAGCGDTCSVEPEVLRDNMATVQIVDAAGEPVADNPIAAGLKAEDEVVIVGTVASSAGSDTLMIMATGIQRVEK